MLWQKGKVANTSGYLFPDFSFSRIYGYVQPSGLTRAAARCPVASWHILSSAPAASRAGSGPSELMTCRLLVVETRQRLSGATVSLIFPEARVSLLISFLGNMSSSVAPFPVSAA